MKKLAVLVNIIAPSRLPVLAYLSQNFDTLVLHGGTESNRNWQLESNSAVKTERVFTLQFTLHRKSGKVGVPDKKFLHLNLGLLWSLPRFAPDFIISYEMGLRTLVALVYGKLKGAPVWVWWGGSLHTERFTSTFRRLFRSFLVRHVTRWISYGATTTEYLESIGIPRARILQIQNCVPQEKFLEVPEGPLRWFENDPRPVFLSVGQLVPRKGIDKLIEASARLQSKGHRFSLVIVGEGPDKRALEKLARDKQLDNFRILPNQSPQNLNELYRSADVFVFPTLEDVWGLVVNEALWAGTPVLCSKYAGCAPELVPGANTFDPLDDADFDAALQKIFDHAVLPADHSRLQTWQQVSECIVRSIQTDAPVELASLNTASPSH